MDGTAAVDRAIDRLDRALRTAGFAALGPAADPAAVHEVDRELAPYALPADLRRFWERVDFFRLRVSSHSRPEGLDARVALETYRLNLEPEFALLYGPPLLFPIARASGDQWSVELTSRWGPGGAVFSHFGDVSGAIRLEYPSFTDLLEVCAELLEEGLFVRWENGSATLDRGHEQERQAARFAARAPTAYGETREIGLEAGSWPAHWLEAAGLDPRDREPRGVTHAIADLRRAASGADDRVEARIAGEVVRATGVGGDVLVLVEDGTGALDVWCPAGSFPWGLTLRGRFEFALAVQGPVPPPLDLAAPHGEATREALAGRIDEASAAVESLLARVERHRPAAVATAVRPLDRRARFRAARAGEAAVMSDEPEQTVGDASRGAEEQHVEEAEEPGAPEAEAAEAPDWDEEDERSPWAE